MILKYVLFSDSSVHPRRKCDSGATFQSLKQLEEPHTLAALAVVAIVTVLDRTHPKHLHFPNRVLSLTSSLCLHPCHETHLSVNLEISLAHQDLPSRQSPEPGVLDGQSPQDPRPAKLPGPQHHRAEDTASGNRADRKTSSTC